MPFDVSIPFVEHLGIELLEREPGRVVTALTLRPELENSWKVAHGGVTMTLLDLTAGMAIRMPGEEKDAVATVNLSVSFMSPGKGRLICEGRVLRRGNTLSTCESEVRDLSGTLVARALGTFVIKKNAVGRER